MGPDDVVGIASIRPRLPFGCSGAGLPAELDSGLAGRLRTLSRSLKDNVGGRRCGN